MWAVLSPQARPSGAPEQGEINEGAPFQDVARLPLRPGAQWRLKVSQGLRSESRPRELAGLF